MTLSVWQSGRLQAVYSPVGVDTNGHARYARNNFDILKWTEPGATNPSEWVVSPTADSATVGAAMTNPLLDEGLAHDFGFYDLQPLLVEVHAVGKGAGDSALDLHFFGPV